MSGNFLTAIHIMTYLAYPGNSGAPATHIVSFVRYVEGAEPLVTSEEIAGVIGNNPVVIRRILKELGRAGLVASARGKTGGYQLGRSANAISLLDIFLAVEGDRVDFFSLAHRDSKPDCSPVATSIQQTLHPLFAQSMAALKENLSRHSVAEVLNTSLARMEEINREGS